MKNFDQYMAARSTRSELLEDELLRIEGHQRPLYLLRPATDPVQKKPRPKKRGIWRRLFGRSTS